MDESIKFIYFLQVTSFSEMMMLPQKYIIYLLFIKNGAFNYFSYIDSSYSDAKKIEKAIFAEGEVNVPRNKEDGTK